MSKVLIIGAGGVGGVVTHKCAQAKDVFSEITLASRTKSKCDVIAAQIDYPINTARVDADNVAELFELIDRERPSLVINVALPYQDLTIMDACLATGVDYLDTANYEPRDTAKFEYHWQWAYQQRFREKGLMALLGSGFDPGVTNVYTALAAKKYLDVVEEIDIIDANAGSHGQPFATNFNPEINIREVTAPCRHWENGKWVETGALTTKHSFDFPEGIGPMNIYRMYHEECYREVKSQAISYTTGVPAVVGAIMMIAGKWHKPGVWNMEQFDPEPFLERLSVMGLPTVVVDGGEWPDL